LKWARIVKVVAAARAIVVLLQVLKIPFAHLQEVMVVGVLVYKIGKFNELGSQARS
jgi:hypothetical protein